MASIAKEASSAPTEDELVQLFSKVAFKLSQKMILKKNKTAQMTGISMELKTAQNLSCGSYLPKAAPGSPKALGPNLMINLDGRLSYHWPFLGTPRDPRAT